MPRSLRHSGRLRCHRAVGDLPRIRGGEHQHGVPYRPARRLHQGRAVAESLYRGRQALQPEPSGQGRALLAEYAGWLSSFTLRTTAFVDVAKTFRERFEHNRRREAESRENSLPQVCRFYIPYLDALNGGGTSGQLTCFLASTGVGKSHLAKHIGIRADIDDGLHVLHYQLEGSEQEALDAYSGGMISRNAYYFEQGKISDPGIQALRGAGDELRRQYHGAFVPALCRPHLDDGHQERDCRIPQNQRLLARCGHRGLNGPADRRHAPPVGRRA